MNPYAELIAKEEAKLVLLRKKVASCERLIAALRGTDSDDIDAAIAKQIDQESPVALEDLQGASTQVNIETAALIVPVLSGMRIRKDSVAPLVLQYLGREGKTLDQIEAYMESIGKPTTRGSLRTMLMNLRVKNKLVDSPKHGFYRLSDDGIREIGLDLT